MTERLRNPRWQLALVVLLYVAYAVVTTWPVTTDPNTRIIGQGGDTFAHIGYWQEIIDEGQVPFLDGRLRDFSAPEGAPDSYALNVATWPSTTVIWLGSLTLGPIAALNLFILLGLVLSATSVFLLMRKLTGHPGAAALAGFAFGFAPFMITKSSAHQQFIHGWVFVLLLWRLYELHDRPTLRNGLLAGAAAVLCVSFTPYFFLLGGTVIGLFAAGQLIAGLRRKDLRVRSMATGIGGLPLLGALAVYALVARTQGDEGEGVRTYSIQELIQFSARVGDYLMPDPNSLLFGRVATEYRVAHLHGSNYSETTFYIGISVLLLGGVALVALLRRELDDRERIVTWSALALAVVAAIMSAPPYFQVFGLTINMPSYYVFEVTQSFRVVARFAILVQLGAALLLAVGVKYIVRERSPAVAAGLVALLAAMVVVDLWAQPPAEVRTSIPGAFPIYKPLLSEPPGGLAEYPILPNAVPEYGALYRQEYHDRPLLNGWAGGSYAEGRAFSLARMDDPATAGRLRMLGMRYVLLVEGTPPGGGLPAGTPDRRFKEIARGDGRILYRIDARPGAPFAHLGPGFHPPEGTLGNSYAWQSSAEATLGITSRCGTCTGKVRFSTVSQGIPRTLTVREEDGKLLRRVRVPATGEIEVSLPVTLTAKETKLDLELSPPPKLLAGDGRELGIAVRNSRFEVTR